MSRPVTRAAAVPGAEPSDLVLDLLAMQEDMLDHPALKLSSEEFEKAKRILWREGLLDRFRSFRVTSAGRLRLAARGREGSG